MKILGLGYGYHDSSSCFIEDGKVVWLVEEDRFTYIKHDDGFPLHSLNSLMNEYSINKDDFDCIIYGENPYKKFLRILKDIIFNTPYSLHEFINFSKEWLGSKLWTMYSIANFFNKPINKIKYLDHHLSHALSSHYTSGKDESLSFVIDALGEDTSISVFRFDKKEKLGKLISKESYKDSLCLLYSLVTHFLGFKPNDSECTTMALASYGQPTYKEKLRELISIDNGKIQINKNIIDFSLFKTDKLTQSLSTHLQIERRLPNEPINTLHIDPRTQELANLASSMQDIYEEILLQYISFHTKSQQIFDLTLSGGGTQNCKFISRLQQEELFSSIYLPPVPGDNGLALGAAIYGLIQNNQDPHVQITHKLGLKPRLDDIQSILSNFSYSDVQSYSIDPQSFSSLRVTKLNTFDMAKNIATQIEENKIVALVSGRSECGPRALGNRSIICKPNNPKIAQRLSTKVKKRAPFRPYAISTLNKYCDDIFKDYKHSTCTKWMQTAFTVKQEARAKVSSCLHIDNTTRPQVFTNNDEGLLHLILQEMDSNGVFPVVLNTSLNESGYPLAKSAKEAYLIFLKTAIDTIVIEDHLIEKIRKE